MVFVAWEAEIERRFRGRYRHRFLILIVQIDLHRLVLLDDQLQVVCASRHHLAAVWRPYVGGPGGSWVFCAQALCQ